jgi:hypothetical protein
MSTVNWTLRSSAIRIHVDTQEGRFQPDDLGHLAFLLWKSLEV